MRPWRDFATVPMAHQMPGDGKVGDWRGGGGEGRIQKKRRWVNNAQFKKENF